MYLPASVKTEINLHPNALTVTVPLFAGRRIREQRDDDVHC